MKINKLVVAIAALSSASVHAGVALTVTAGSADYELSVAEVGYEEVIDDRFNSRDISLDYSWDNHQVGIKVGGLAKVDDAIDATFDESQWQAVVLDQGAVERDEWSLFYTYRLENGIALTGGYYNSEAKVDRNFEVSGGDYFGDGSDWAFTDTQHATKNVDNKGIFLGAAYGMSFTDRLGGFVRAGYQTSKMKEEIAASRQTEIPEAQWVDNISMVRDLESDGSAVVYGIGLFYGIAENWSTTLFVDVKNFSYDDAKYNNKVFDADGNSLFSGADETDTKIDESQTTIGISLRYMF